MRIALFGCWANMKIYAVYTSNLRKALSTISGQRPEAITTRCMCFKTDNPAEQEFSFIDIPYYVRQIRSKNRFKYYLKLKLYGLVEARRGRAIASRYSHFDLIDFQQSSYAFGYEAIKAFLSNHSQTKKIVTIHKLDQIQKDSPALNKTYNAADAVIVFTDDMKQSLASQGVDPDKLHVILHGTSLPPLKDYPKQQAIMFCGSPIPQVKGFEDLVVALEMLKQEGIDLKVKIYGFFIVDEKEAAIALAREHGVDGLLEWQSFKNEDELAEEHQRSLFCLIPYRSYAGCFPAAHAMGNGIPVIATDTLGHAEYIDGAGLLIPPADPSRLAEAIKKLLNDEDLRNELGRAARKKAEQELGWQTVATKTLEVFDGVMKA